MENRNRADPKIKVEFSPDFEDKYIKAFMEVMQAGKNQKTAEEREETRKWA